MPKTPNTKQRRRHNTRERARDKKMTKGNAPHPFLTKLAADGQQAKASLKKAATIVTDASGRRYNEASAAYEETSGDDVGYVVDTHPDPGLYECIPGLFIGSQDAAHNFDGMSVPKKKTKKETFTSSSHQQSTGGSEKSQEKQQDQDNNNNNNDEDYFPGISNLGITHVVNLFSNDRPFEDRGVQYLNVLMLDLPEQSLSDCLEEPLAFLDRVLVGRGGASKDDNNDANNKINNSNGRILIHCNAGVSRSSTIIIAYLIKYKGMTYEESLKIVQQARPTAMPNAGFQDQLKALEKGEERSQ